MRRASIVTICLTLLAAMLSVALPPAASAAPVCQTPFATAGYPPGWQQLPNTTTDWSTTDGNVIAQDVSYATGGPYLVIGGNFTYVNNKATGGRTPARNLAVLRIRDGHVMWGASSMTGYVKAITVDPATNTFYVGGGFSQINGVPRKAVAAFSVTSYAMRSWTPVVNGGTIRSIQVSKAGVAYLAGNGGVGAYRTDNAAKVWYAASSAGVVRSVLLSPDEQGLYVGGDFSALAGAPINNLAVIYPISGGKVDTKFNPHLRKASVPGGSDAELVLEQAWDYSSPQLRLIVGRGGSTTNGIMSIDPYFGGHFWSYNTEGDTQAVEMLGNTILMGNHRSHGNYSGCPYGFFANQWATRGGPGDRGFVLPWDAGLSGNPTQASYLSEANGGISDILYDPQTRQVFVVGDFQKWGASCNYDTLACTGGIPKRGIAVYKVP